MADGDKEFDENAVRLTAYFLWEAAGSPPGGANEYWEAARTRYLREKECDKLMEEQPPPRQTLHQRL